VLAAPIASHANKKAHERSRHRFTEQSGLPCAMVYGLFRALPGDRLFDSHISELQCGAVFDTAKGFEAKPHDLWTGLSIVGGPSS